MSVWSWTHRICPVRKRSGCESYSFLTKNVGDFSNKYSLFYYELISYQLEKPCTNDSCLFSKKYSLYCYGPISYKRSHSLSQLTGLFTVRRFKANSDTQVVKVAQHKRGIEGKLILKFKNVITLATVNQFN